MSSDLFDLVSIRTILAPGACRCFVELRVFQISVDGVLLAKEHDNEPDANTCTHTDERDMTEQGRLMSFRRASLRV